MSTAEPPTASTSQAVATESEVSVRQPPTPRRKAAAPQPDSPSSRDRIRENDNVLIRLPSGVLKAIKINKTGNVSLGKYGSFKSADLIGRPYGPTYEIVEGGLQVLKATLKEIEETAANNENISSTGAQKLSHDDIAALREAGLDGRDIIARQIEEHNAFELKTEYSKDKYMKRKQAKYLKLFTPIEPTVHNICEYLFERDSQRIREIRPDTLSLMMTMANVRPGSKLLVVEDVGGLVVAAALERMGGEGRIMVINGVDSPPDLHFMSSFNFAPSQREPIRSLHFAATQESWAPADLPLEIEDPAQVRNSRDWSKVKKRKALYDKLNETRQEFFDGGFDGVILATEYDPSSVLDLLLPKISGSSPVLVYSPYLPVLCDLQMKLRDAPDFLAPSISEPWLRKYQVLPGRTHPEMAGMQHGGYILSATRVFDDETANSFASATRANKRRKKAGGGERSRNEEKNVEQPKENDEGSKEVEPAA